MLFLPAEVLTRPVAPAPQTEDTARVAGDVGLRPGDRRATQTRGPPNRGGCRLRNPTWGNSKVPPSPDGTYVSETAGAEIVPSRTRELRSRSEYGNWGTGLLACLRVPKDRVGTLCAEVTPQPGRQQGDGSLCFLPGPKVGELDSCTPPLPPMCTTGTRGHEREGGDYSQMSVPDPRSSGPTSTTLR